MMHRQPLYFLLVSIFVVGGDSRDSSLETCEPVVAIDFEPSVLIPHFGSLIGSTTLSQWKKRTIHQYQGIPYAQPPVGDRRFKPPKRLDPESTQVYEATSFKPKCPQYYGDDDFVLFKNSKRNIEDCLYMNIYVPEVGKNKTSLLPVMFFIHGGSFLVGTANEYCPNYLLDNDVILVTIQYRLGSLGFLSLQIDDIPGNMGFMDQLLALEWVHENIIYFGGDNKKITIFGQSAGGAAVTLMLVSPLVKPYLFQQLIVQSGNLMGDWVYDSNPVTHAKELAKYVNCTQTDVHELATCLMRVSAIDLTLSNVNYLNDKIGRTGQANTETGISHATIQQAGTEKFLTEDARLTFLRGNYRKVPTMTGLTKNDGSFMMTVFFNIMLQRCEAQINQCVNSSYLNNDVFYDYLRFIGVSNHMSILEMSKDLYLPKHLCDNILSAAPGLIDLATDLKLKIPTMNLVRNMYQHTPTYLYTFSYKGEHTKFGYGDNIPYPFSGGVAHGDETIYLFPFKNHVLNEEDNNMAKKISRLWTEFAHGASEMSVKYKWPPVSSRNGPYLQILQEPLVRNNFIDEYRIATKEANTFPLKSYSLQREPPFQFIVLYAIITFILK